MDENNIDDKIFLIKMNSNLIYNIRYIYKDNVNILYM